MNHIVSISGGVNSAVCADRVLKRFGYDAVTLWFADTSWEDEDLYRFLNDLEQHWEKKISRHVDGRTPLQVGEDENFIPNQRRPICSRILKQEPFKAFVRSQPKPVTIYLGMDWTEMHRMEAPKLHYESIEGVTVDFPLMWKPYCFDTFGEVRSWGIETPKLYKDGFPHNNCGGRCVRQGIVHWRRLLYHYPERFEEVNNWEKMMRAKGAPLDQYAIVRDQSERMVRPRTLEQVKKMDIEQAESNAQEDLFACFCEY